MKSISKFPTNETILIKFIAFGNTSLHFSKKIKYMHLHLNIADWYDFLHEMISKPHKSTAFLLKLEQ